MSRNLKDVLLIMMQIELQFSKLYRSMSVIEGQHSGRFKAAAAVLSREEAEHYEWYKGLVENDIFNEIKIEDDFFEVIRNNLEMFRATISMSSFNTGDSLVKTAYEYELKNAEILWKIYGILSEGRSEEEDALKKWIEVLIKTEEKHAENLKQFLKS